MNKFCPECKKEKPEEEFTWKDKKKNLRAWICKNCHRAYKKEWYQNNKKVHIDGVNKYKLIRRNKIRQEINEMKMSSGCVKCGYKKCVEALDFHHQDNHIKEECISKMICLGFSLSKLKKEIEKCIIVCSNCHREIHRAVLAEK